MCHSNLDVDRVTFLNRFPTEFSVSDGRLLTLFRVGQWVQKTLLGRMLDFHFRKHMPRIFTGEDATNRYSLGLVSFMTQYGLAGNDPEALRIN